MLLHEKWVTQWLPFCFLTIGLAVWAIVITLVDDVWLFAPLRLLGP